ncbi:MAG: hypothetical protein JJU32_16550 [Phormidium sp. BM_Day4_Bin.17]|nr:hypothetical protein [Phormidium sp. BM_Day4_Bin.17]UCJ10828.1 MAG: hypothetical protein JWS08_13460 [Phormidium sp. PBR-2020]
MMSNSLDSQLWETQSTENPDVDDSQITPPESPGSSPLDSLKQRLQEQAMLLSPLEEALADLAALREPRLLEGKLKTPQKLKSASSAAEVTDLPGQDVQSPPGKPQQELDTQDLERAIALKRERLEHLFWHWVPPTLSDRRDLSSLIEQMGDRQLRQEAQMQRGAMANVMEQLPSSLHQDELDVFGLEAQSLLGRLLDLERRQRVIERLLWRDRTVPAAVITFSMLYSLGVVALVVLFVIFWGHGFVVEGVSEQKLPLIGLPWPVFVWGLFGSLSAVVTRFLYHPFRRLREMSQWMLLRPIQGVVLAGASYFILQALLSLLIPLQPDTPRQITDEAMLLLSFVVGFSDRLGMRVFRWLSQTDSQNRNPQNC